MSCKPTVGETRECFAAGRYRVASVLGEDGTVTDAGGRWHNAATCGRIVEVAPKNQARVTAGPPWMSVTARKDKGDKR